MKSLDDEMMLLALERVGRGTITVQKDEYGREWYHDNGLQCPLATRLLDVLTEQDYIRWDSMVGPVVRLRVREDGIRAVVLDDKGRAARTWAEPGSLPRGKSRGRSTTAG